MKKWLKRLALIALVLITILGGSLWTAAWSIQDRLLSSSAVGLDIDSVAAGGVVHMLEGVRRDGRRRMAAVAASVGPDGILLVDTIYHGAEEHVLEELDRLGGGEIRYIINTHAHLDHAGGNAALREGAQVIAHSAAARQISSPVRWVWWLRSYPAHPGWAPDVTLDSEMRMEFNGEEIRILPFPNAHTAGDLVVYFTVSKVLVCGDIFNGPGRFSTPSDVYGGEPDALVAALESILEWLPEDASIITGHGPTRHLSTKAELSRYVDVLTSTMSSLKTRLSAGSSLDEFLAESPDADWRQWAEDADEGREWVSALYELMAHAD
jgi:glyoxylase-like metal-dependent hydrolase (beta-lactamase superfamily II)